MLYKFLSGLAKGVTHCIFRVKVVGKENVPKDGGMILAVNHKSNWDPIFAGAYCPRPLRFMAKSLITKLCRRLPMKLCRQFIRLTIQILRKSENKND